MTPTPAQPSEGANFYRLRDVPQDWEWRFLDDEDVFEVCPDELRPRLRDVLVEARPKPEPLVAVMLPKVMVEYGAAGCGMRYEEKRTFFDACRAALEADS